MAGGNLSPRQKMINMMYLVLTALLALNVSAEILEAFQSLRSSLKSSAESFREKNEDTRQAIIAKVNDEISQGNKKNEYVLELNKEVQAKTAEVIGYINGVVKELEKIGEAEESTGEIINKKETEANYQYWMGAGQEMANGGRGAGAAMKLKDELNGFVDYARAFVAKYDSAGNSDIKFEYIAIDPEDDKNVPETNENSDKTWEYFTFHSKPVIADLAMMEKFKLDVEEVHSELLNFLKTKLGAVTFKIDSLIAVDAPVSRVVAAGMKFETQLFVAMSSSEIKPEFIGSGIKTNADGNSATMTFTAPGGFAKGQTERKATYRAMIKVPKADGSFAELPVQGEYIVRKPEVVITSASVQNLYQNCGNTINVDVPALGEFYNPVLKASQAKVIPSKSDKRKITIVPTGKTCVLNVASNTNGQMIKIDNVKYKVIKPPKPDILLLINGKEYNGASPVNKKSKAKVRIRPDSDFRSALPRDARYMINKVDLLAQRSLGAPTKVKSISGGGKDAVAGITVPFARAFGKDVAGTKVYVKLDGIYRVNFQNKKVKERFGDRDLYIGAVIK